LNILAKIGKEKILFKVIELLGGKPIMVIFRRSGKRKWGIMYIEEIIYK
jgi:hypothetical protein